MRTSPAPMFLGMFAERTPDKPAVVMAASGATLTYAELERGSNQVAQAMRRAGLRRGDHVAYLLENCPTAFEIIWGAMRAGCYYTPINVWLSAAEAAYIVRDSGSTVLFVSARYAATAQEIMRLVPEVTLLISVEGTISGFRTYEETVRTEPTEPIPDESQGSSMKYSAGTTGRPKGVKRPLPEGTFTAADPWLDSLCELYGWGPDTRYLCPAPLYHGAGLWYTTAMHRIGATAIVMERFDAEGMLRAIEQYAVTCVQVVPTMLIRALRLPEHVRTSYDLSSLSSVIHSAAPCPVPVKEAILDWLGPIVYEYYAGTEGIGYCWISPQEWLTHRGSVGRPKVGVVHIVDDDGNEVPVGETGAIYFETVGEPFTYHGDAEKTAKSRHPKGWTTADDAGHLDADGYLYLSDRRSHLIISGGVNIYPQEVEDFLITHPAVDDAAVIGVPNDEFGEEVKAVVVTAPGEAAAPELARRLIEDCRRALAHYKCPRTVDFVLALPRGENGKLYKRKIRDAYWPQR